MCFSEYARRAHSNRHTRMARRFGGLSLRVLSIGVAAIIVALLVGGYLWRQASIPPAPSRMRLADGVEIFFLTGSAAVPSATYPHPREIRVDGDFFFRVPDSSTPLVLRSRLLVLTVNGQSALRVTAYAKEAGEQVEVLQGHIKAQKSYPSTYAEPDLLTEGQMTMINRDIDLMEKETTDVAALRAWSDALVESVSRAAVTHQSGGESR